MSSNNQTSGDSTVGRPSESNNSELNYASGNDTTIFPRGGSATDTRTSGSITTTMTITATNETTSSNNGEILHLTLRPRPSVRWDENVEDNEGMGRKSSKRCCIFHKQREFGESSTDSSADDDDDDNDNSNNDVSDNENDIDTNDRKPKAVSDHRKRKIARPKSNAKNVPDYQRFHA
jgi:protein phosphatase 1 regulatory subunit 11